MTKAITLMVPFVLLACGSDAFIGVVVPGDSGQPDADPDAPDAPIMEGGSMQEAGTDAQQGVTEAGVDAPADAPKEAADCSVCMNTDNLNCKPVGGWTGNYCPCECFMGLSPQAIAHCGAKGCICEPSHFPMNPGLSCIKSVP